MDLTKSSSARNTTPTSEAAKARTSNAAATLPTLRLEAGAAAGRGAAAGAGIADGAGMAAGGGGIAAPASATGGGGGTKPVGLESLSLGACAAELSPSAGGGGGGGAYYNSVHYIGGAGGSGIVIIRYADTYIAATSTTGSPTITVAGGYRVYKWITVGSGSITF